MQLNLTDNDFVLLSKKITMPGLPADAIMRAELVSLLNACIKQRVTLVCAPAGFGKSCLLTLWAEQPGSTYAWLTLDREDNRYDRFWSYVFASFYESGVPIEVMEGDIEAVLRSVNIYRAIDSLCQSLAHFEKDVTFVVEDFHCIAGDSLVPSTFLYFIQHMPDNTHVVISSRSNPLLPIERLRSEGCLTEIAPDALLFTPCEIEEFFAPLGINLLQGESLAIRQFTEGWPLAVKLVALAHNGSLDLLAKEHLGSVSKMLGNYLLEEVMGNAPQKVEAPTIANLAHKRALSWCKGQGYYGLAVALASTLEDYAVIKQIILTVSFGTKQADYSALLQRWLRLLPSEYAQNNPALRLIETTYALKKQEASCSDLQRESSGAAYPTLKEQEGLSQQKPLLTKRESSIMELAAEGSSTKEIAALLFVSPETVKKHLSNIYSKLGANSRAQAVAQLAEYHADSVWHSAPQDRQE